MSARLVIPQTAPDFLDWLPSRSGKIGNNTYAAAVEGPDGRRRIEITYHRTVIAAIDTWTGVWTLDTGGWRTVTTKDRLNTLGRIIGWHIWSDHGTWHIADSFGEREFYDGIKSLGSRRCPIGCECSR